MSCGNIGRGSTTAYKKESTWGTYITPDKIFRVYNNGLDTEVEHTEDPAFIGKYFPTNQIKIKETAGGTLEVGMHPDTCGEQLYFALGGQTLGNPVAGFLLIWYTGSEKYAELVVNSGSLTAEVGDDEGSASADTNFNGTGTYNISAVALATVASTINGFTGWNAAYKGSATVLGSNIVNVTKWKLKENNIRIGAFIGELRISGSTTAKTHLLYPSTIGTCLPSQTIQVNKTLGTDKSVAYTGCKTNSITINNAVNDIVRLSLALLGKREERDKTDLALDIPTYPVFNTNNVTLFINELQFPGLTSFSIPVNNNLSDQTIVGSEYRVEPIRQSSTIETSFEAFLVTGASGNYQYREDYFLTDTPVELIAYFENTYYVDETNDIKASVLIRLNQNKISAFPVPLTSPDRITISGTAMVKQPLIDSENHIEIHVTDDILTNY